jgi:hypothetical protein
LTISAMVVPFGTGGRVAPPRYSAEQV